MKKQTSAEYVKTLQENLINMKNRKGVTRYRSMVAAAIEQHQKFSRLMRDGAAKPYTYDKWLWRKGFKHVDYLDRRERACKKALELPAIWLSGAYDSIELVANPYACYPPKYNEYFKDICFVWTDQVAKKVYIEKHTSHINAIVKELQPEFLPETFARKNGRGEVTDALNIDIYAWDSSEGLGVIQVRQFGKGRHFNRVLKSYFLIGRNENGNAFCHCVPSASFRNRKGNQLSIEDKVKMAQAWIFQVPLEKFDTIIRQGDMAFLCLQKRLPIPNNPFIDKGTILVIGGSHKIQAEQILEDQKTGKLYALKPEMIHEKNQHLPICCTAWAEILVGRSYESHNFARTSID